MSSANFDSEIILIVEDSPTQALKLEMILEDQGYQVITAGNGKEALQCLEEHSPFMVISDIEMPVMDGYELCRKIRSDEKLQHIPVTLLTSLSDPENVIKGLESGAHNYILKPIDEQYLISHIDYIKKSLQLKDRNPDQKGVEIYFDNKVHVITSNRKQILDFLISTYEITLQKNQELEKAKKELNTLNNKLEEKVIERTKKLTQINNKLHNLAEEREILLAEVHHRVKNNLAIISGLLQLETGFEDDSTAHAALVKSISRIKLIAAIHEHLYKSQSFSNISFETYITKLVEIIKNLYQNESKGIKVNIHSDEMSLNINQALPCALILSELISNSYKHAFKGRNQGQIDIKMSQKGDDIEIIVKDNGVGLDKNEDPVKSSSLGYTLVETLSKQLHAEYYVTNDEGTKTHLQFKRKHNVRGASGNMLAN